MRRMVGITLFSLALVVLVSGCSEPPPPPEPENLPPPEPSVDQIYGELKGTIAPFYEPFKTRGWISPKNQTEVVTKLKSLKAKYTAMQNGRAALGRFEGDVQALIKRTRDEERWRLLIGCLKLFEVLRPGSLSDPAERYSKLMARAELMMQRPHVAVRGFFDIEGEMYAFLDVTHRTTKEVESHRVREGEEFYAQVDPVTGQPGPAILRLVRIIGDRQAVELLYIPVNDTWELLGPKERN